MRTLLGICLFFLAIQVIAQPAATISSTSNNATVQKNGQVKKLSSDNAVGPGDTITTPTNTKINLKYSNGTLVTLGGNSRYKIVAYNQPKTDVKIKAELQKGKMYSKTSGKMKEHLKTPVIGLAILGTEYRVYIANPNTVYIQVIQGSVQAGGQVYTAGSSFKATPQGITSAPFPPEGIVNPDDTSAQAGSNAEPTIYVDALELLNNNSDLVALFNSTILANFFLNAALDPVIIAPSVVETIAIIDIINC